MQITLTVKRTPGTKEKDREIVFVPITKLNLSDAKVLWEFEQFINAHTSSRIHIDLKEL